VLIGGCWQTHEAKQVVAECIEAADQQAHQHVGIHTANQQHFGALENRLQDIRGL
jgi:hypothetical protein